MKNDAGKGKRYGYRLFKYDPDPLLHGKLQSLKRLLAKAPVDMQTLRERSEQFDLYIPDEPTARRP